MRYLLSTLLLVVCALATAAPPSGMTAQGRLTSVAGTPAPDGSYDVIFSLWNAEKNGQQLWSEEHFDDNGLVVQKGTFSTTIGAIKPMTTAVFMAPEIWLQMRVLPNAPLPRKALRAVPFAQLSQAISCSGCIDNTHLNPNVMAPYAKTADMPNMALYAMLTDLAEYAKTKDLAPYAKTADMPNMALYALITDLAEYAKTADLAPYAKTADMPNMALYALLTDLAEYAKIQDLAPYAKTADMPNMALYALLTDLAEYAKTQDLAPYAKTADLAPYAKTTDLDQLNTALGYVKKTCVGCVSKDMIDTKTAALFETQTTSIPWSKITQKPAGFEDDTDDGGGALVSEADQTCDTQTLGQFWYNTANKLLQFCDGKNWNIVQMAIMPTVPQDLTSTTVSSIAIKLTWSSVEGVDKYTIHKSTDNVTFKEYQATVATQFTDDNLSANQSYFYKVASANGAGVSGLSPSVKATTAFDYQGAVRTAKECADAGASLVSVTGDSSGNQVCRFKAASCPKGWTQAGQWTTTKQGSCGITGRYGGGCEPVVGSKSCATGSHGWSNNGTVETVACNNNCGGWSNSCGSAQKACPSGTALCYEGCLPNPKCVACTNCTAKAIITEVGCK